MKPFYIVALCIFMSFGGCSTASHKSEHSLHQILLYNLHFRRTVLPGAMPNAELGDERYESHPKPNKNLDCNAIPLLFKGYDLVAIRDCLNNWSKSLKEAPPDEDRENSISYILQRDAAPFMFLEKPETAPECMKKLLEEIPVPREIFYQSNEEGSLSCYNSRLKIHDDDPGSVNVLFDQVRIKVQPPQVELTTDEELVMQLGIWAISPFWEEDGKLIRGKIVSTEICKRCMGGEKNLFVDTDPIPPLWPKLDR